MKLGFLRGPEIESLSTCVFTADEREDVPRREDQQKHRDQPTGSC